MWFTVLFVTVIAEQPTIALIAVGSGSNPGRASAGTTGAVVVVVGAGGAVAATEGPAGTRPAVLGSLLVDWFEPPTERARAVPPTSNVAAVAAAAIAHVREVRRWFGAG
jgi:hypothetical protein